MKSVPLIPTHSCHEGPFRPPPPLAARLLLPPYEWKSGLSRSGFGEDSMQLEVMEMIRRATDFSFAFGVSTEDPFYRPAPDAFMRIYLVASVISRFGANSQAVKESVVSPLFATFFGLEADDACVGCNFATLVGAVGLEWPCALYERGTSVEKHEVEHPQKWLKNSGKLSSSLIPVHIATGAPETSDVRALIEAGFATPLLYTGETLQGGPADRALAMQLLIGASDALVPGKGFMMGSSPWPELIWQPLLRLQVLTLHPHIEMLLALLVYVRDEPSKAGRGKEGESRVTSRSETLCSTEAVRRKNRHFIGQTMGMKCMSLPETSDACIQRSMYGASGGAFCHRDTLQMSRSRHVMGLFRFDAMKWDKRNVGYLAGAREHVKRGEERLKAQIVYVSQRGEPF